ncbi:MAG: SgcJ/EcaC family oxidoreductase [Mycolicibacter algericus]|uniref:SgcJ/EcaC family oxidoreductase n=1 Tax=Mycolicibacter algericus TaxID=1288388 RepID=UPI003C796FFA
MTRRTCNHCEKSRRNPQWLHVGRARCSTATDTARGRPWRRTDRAHPEAYAAVFTRDADYVTFLGQHYKGREAIAAAYARLFAKLLRGSRLHTEITGLRFLTPSMALIRANAAVTKRGRQRNRRGVRVNTSVAVRTSEGWLLAASQNTTHRHLADQLMQKLAGSSSSSRHG